MHKTIKAMVAALAMMVAWCSMSETAIVEDDSPSVKEKQIDYSITNRIYTYGTVCESGNSYSTVKYISPVEASGVITNGSAIFKYDYQVEWDIIGAMSPGNAYSSDYYELVFAGVNSNEAKMVIYPLKQDDNGCAVFVGEINVPNILLDENGHCEVRWCANEPFYGGGQIKISDYSFRDVSAITVPSGWEFPIVYYNCEDLFVTIVGKVGGPAIPMSASGEVIIPSVIDNKTVARLDQYSLCVCENITSLVIPDSMLNICSRAVMACNGVSSIAIPKSVTSIEEYAFSCCGSLTNLSVDVQNPFYSSVNGSLYDKQVTYLLCAPGGVKGNFVVPSTVKRIAAGAFYGCSQLTSVEIPPGVISIGENAFCGCYELTCVTIPSSVTSIGSESFSGCSGLKTIYVDDGDETRVRQMLEASGFDTTGVVFKVLSSQGEGDKEPDDPVIEDFDGSVKHTFNGLVYDSGVMCGMIQIATAKATKKGVKVSGSVILEDGKKVSIKAVTVAISGGQLVVNTTVGKLGALQVTIGENGFEGTLGNMTVAKAEVDEETGILSATVKLTYFDAKTGKIKTKSYKLNGITSGGEAVGSVSLKSDVKGFEAVVK